MSSVNQSQVNVTAGLQYRGLLEKVMLTSLTTIWCCVFLFMNGVMLLTLRSKRVFCETSRYILLFNLLCADTMQMALSQFLYLLAAFGIRLTYPVCGVLAMLTDLTNTISPLTLVAMSLERYVAVCFPLRHTAIITMRSTARAIFVVWAFSSLNILIRVILLLDFSFEDLESLQMDDFCAKDTMKVSLMSTNYDHVFSYFLFISASVAVTSTYIGVMMAARSASTDNASARKARNTLLLHVVQLGLTLCSTIYNPILISLWRIVTWIVFMRIHIVLYVCIILFPRCLSSLIYGIRDRTIRLVFLNNLCCPLSVPSFQAKVSK